MTTRLRPLELESFRTVAKIQLARSGFFDYCRAVDPGWYIEERPLLVDFCNTLENFYFRKLLKDNGDPYTKIKINMPPRHSKTRTLVHFCNWCHGINNHERIITASYNDDTAHEFSRFARDGITATKNDPYDIVFSDIFPGTKIKRGQASYEKWALAGEHFSYLGAGIGGSITGKGGTIRMIDDPVKGAFEAYNTRHLDKLWLWYTSTFLSRIEPGDEGLDIIVMTRWSKFDFCGRLDDDEESAKDWYTFSREAYDEATDEMLESHFLSKKKYFEIKHLMDPAIFSANYHQRAITETGSLFKHFNTYSAFPTDDAGRVIFERVAAYIDSADTGDDWLCSIIYGTYSGKAYILDVYYSGEPMEVTEPRNAEQLVEYDVKIAKFESNGAGRGYARNVKRILKDVFHHTSTVIKWFHQSMNKEVRIFTWSAWCQENIIMPVDWKSRWSRFYADLTAYTKEEQKKNERDDAPDALTGVAEEMTGKRTAKAFKRFI